MVKQAARNATKKKGAVTKKKTVTKAKQKKEQDHHHASSSSSSSPSIRSKFVGVSWYKQKKKWKAEITIDGKKKHLGYFDDEKEAACKYDEQAALLNKPVNFPQHEGQEQAVKQRKDRSKVPDVMRRSKFVGVSWNKQKKKWKAEITIDGKIKHLGYFDDEKEAACKYDEQAALLNKPVNFPQHEGQEQAVKRAPKGSVPKRKSPAKPSKHGNDGEVEEEEEEAIDEDSDDDEDDMIILDDDHQAFSSSQTPTFLQHLVHQQATFLQVKQELQDDLQEATHQAQQARDDATDDSHLCVVCMDEERGVLYVPCNHLAVCVGCEEGLAAASMACPMCQEPIDRSRSITGIVVS